MGRRRRLHTLWLGLVIGAWSQHVVASPAAALRAATDRELREVTRRLEREPGSVPILLERGQLLRSAGKFEASLDDLNTARALAPNDPEVRFQLGLTLTLLARDADAQREIELALARGFVSDAAHFELGSIHRRARRYEQAVAEFRMCLVINALPEHYLALGETLNESGKPDEAIKVYQSGYELYRSGVERTGADELLQAWVSLELGHGNHQRALQLMREVWKRKVVAVRWHLLHARALEASGKTRKARQLRKVALRVANARVRSRSTTGNLLERAAAREALGYHEAALQDAQRALRQAPVDASARQLVAQLTALTSTRAAR